MISSFYNSSHLAPDKIVIGSDFDILKRDPIHKSFVGYNQVSSNSRVKIETLI